MPHLLSLDLSHSAVDPAGLGALLEAGPAIRELRARGCGLRADALAALGKLEHLEELDLAENMIDSAESLQRSLAPVRRGLKSLAVAGNPFLDSGREAFAQWLTAECPCLRDVDGAAPEIALKQTTDLAELAQFAGSAGGDGAVQDSASCSCLEGNPCAVPYNCKDWPNRFKVAEDRRRELGYQLTR
mmetsp:Transcript_21276/g.60597  ORF Transcript_21276/g.60597 Transcript_21276/m.60597 type:complete len:187 (-) Transcript_21276:2754-3314(-)